MAAGEASPTAMSLDDRLFSTLTEPAGGLCSNAQLDSESSAGLPLSASLHRLLEGLGLGVEATESAVRAAAEWCDEQGYASASEILEVCAAAELVSVLQLQLELKPGKARLLGKRLAELAPAARDAPSRDADLMRTHSPEAMPVGEDPAIALTRFDCLPPPPLLAEPSGDDTWRALAHAYELAESRLESSLECAADQPMRV